MLTAPFSSGPGLELRTWWFSRTTVCEPVTLFLVYLVDMFMMYLKRAFNKCRMMIVMMLIIIMIIDIYSWTRVDLCELELEL